jgi:purine-binding chemotaxis protein CheW
VPVEHLIETMRPLPVAGLPSAPPFVRGVARIRGAAVPVVDVGTLLGEAEPAASGRFVTVKAGDRPVALAVEAVLGLRTLPGASFGVLPPLLGQAEAGVVGALGALDGELLVVLNAARSVPDPVWRALEAGSPA